ncbi:hypothetical protein NJBCHELONAE_01950 [Mycobacteroides chelonae]|nr:hypothetical protein NJBCHELONAE_01950 [Mycobacteroides chelonae]
MKCDVGERRGELAGAEAALRSGVPELAAMDAEAVRDGVEPVRSHERCESARRDAEDRLGVGAVGRSWAVTVVGMLVHHDHRRGAAGSIATRGSAA